MKNRLTLAGARSVAVRVIALGAIALTAAPTWADGRYTFRVDVAMNGATFHDFEANPDPNRAGIPPNGSPFIIQGYIYRAGTFERYGDTSGVLADGSPEFPERVIGTWICRGWHLQDGDAVAGPVVATTQIFEFDLEQPGQNMLITDGIELADFDVPFRRAVTGGTGVFSRASGEMVQTYVWDDPNYLNASGGFNTSFEFRLQQAVTLPLTVFK